jgi:hypothetical protein
MNLGVLSLPIALAVAATAAVGQDVPSAVPTAVRADGIVSSGPPMENLVHPRKYVPRECRENPTWPGPLHERCSMATGWSPSLNFPSWVDEQSYWEDTFEFTVEFTQCVNQHMDSWSRREERDQNPMEEEAILPPAIVGSYKDKHGDSILLQVNHALSEAEAYGVQALSACVQEILPDHTDYRAFPSGGGNDVVYMASLLQKFVPGVASQLSSLVHLAHGAMGVLNNPPLFFPDPSTLGIRTTEHLSYQQFQDGLGVHADSGSVFTLLLALTDPGEFEGGYFFLDLEDGGEVLFKPPRLSALIFLSDAFHGVKPIPRGHRETFATEFWIYPDALSHHTRPSEVGFEYYLELLKEDPDAEFPSQEEIDEFQKTGRSIWPIKAGSGGVYGANNNDKQDWEHDTGENTNDRQDWEHDTGENTNDEQDWEHDTGENNNDKQDWEHDTVGGEVNELANDENERRKDVDLNNDVNSEL